MAILHRLASFRIGNGGAILVRLLGLSATLHLFATFRIGNAELSVAKPAPAMAIFHRIASFRIGNGGAILVRLLGLSGILHRLATFRIGNAGLSLAKPAPATAILHRLASFRIGNGGAILARLPWAFGDFTPVCYVPNWRRVRRAWRLAVANAGSRNRSKIATCGHSLPQSVHEDAEDT